ncbi:uncharacterized protein [Antedon mediterranea]|uniref:uncharacterized protein n=1 Tax=Antedon mediterranea TaxID=105859 RepID=UPI003AF932B4
MDTGAGTNPLCLPEIPEYDERMVANGSHRANVYGAEYETNFKQYPQWRDVHQTDPACAVCLAKGRSASIMIPAKRTCPEGWTKEYGGLLMGGCTHHNAAHEYLCVDGSPQSRDNSKTNKNGFLLYPAVGKCGSLKCPPYVDYHELSCVVCTR